MSHSARRTNRPRFGRILLLAAALVAGTTGARAASGPDVTVFNLSDTTNYGTAGGIRGYSVGTTSCNMGDQPLNWCNDSSGCGNGTAWNDHPVIGQNMYRLKNGRFDQIGASWLKHGFTSLNNSSSGCGNGSCAGPPLGSDQLGVGCTDPYISSLNGNRPMGRKSEVNATTGDFPMPPGGGGSTAAVWNQRVAVAEADMDATLNPGAVYFIEGQYVAPDDASSGNGLNNASYRKVTVTPGSFNLVMDGSTVREKSAIEAWPVIDPTVELVNVDVPSTPVQRFHVARKVTDLGGGVWHYEIAVHNMNSDRAASKLTVRFLGTTSFTNVGFHDVNAHSNEPYDTTDWASSTSAEEIVWEAAAFSPPANANALRWANLYNFWFDANRPPEEVETNLLGLFAAGTPSELEFLASSNVIFVDGFGSEDTSAWSATFP